MVRPTHSITNQQQATEPYGIEHAAAHPSAQTAPDEVSTTRPIAPYSSVPSEIPSETSSESQTSCSRASGTGFFSNLSDAEYAVTALRSVSFPLNQITLVANHFRRQDQFTDVNLHNRLEAVAWELAAEQAQSYQERLSCGEYLIRVHGTADELERAAAIFDHHGIQDWQMHAPTGVHQDYSLQDSERVAALPAPHR